MMRNDRKYWRLLLFALLITTACDPGMRIRQRNNPAAIPSQNPAHDTLDIRVEEDHPFTGSTWYAPEVKLTNKEKQPITIKRIELIAQGKTHLARDPRKPKLEEVIDAGASANLVPWFDLDKSVGKIFSGGAELKVYYKSGEEEKTSTVELEGLDLN